MAQIKLQHTKHLWAFTKGNNALGTRCLVQCHGFRTALGFQYHVPPNFSLHFYVDGGYSLENTIYPARNPTGAVIAWWSVEMKHILEGRIQPTKTVSNAGAYTDYMMSKDDTLSYADIQYFLDNGSKIQNNWDVVTVRGRSGTLYVNLSDMVGKLEQNGYTDVHLFLCRSSLAHPSRSQLPGGYTDATYPRRHDPL